MMRNTTRLARLLSPCLSSLLPSPLSYSQADASLKQLPRLFLLTFLLLSMVVCAEGLPAYYEDLPAHPREQEFFDESNDIRASYGVPRLEYDYNLTLAARHHAAEMVRLNYLSHISPVDGNATLYHRIVRAGSTALRVQENLAQVRNQEDSISESIAGWLDSPGHRANFLDSQHTHMGVALAEDDKGSIYTVQIFAYQPVILRDYTTNLEQKIAYQTDITFSVAHASEVSFFHHDTNTPSQSYQAGRHSQQLTLADAEPWHLRMGVRPRHSYDSFVLEDEGWVTPETGEFAPSHAATRRNGRILELDIREVRRQMVAVQLVFAEPLPEGAQIFFAEKAIEDMEVQGSYYNFRLPRATVENAERAILDVGLLSEENRGEYSYKIVMQMHLQIHNALPRLQAVSPELSYSN